MMLSSPKRYLLLALVSMGACGLFGNNEDQPKTVFSSGQATALLNGETWEGNASGGINIADVLSIELKNENVPWPRIESFGLLGLFGGEGIYPQYPRVPRYLGYRIRGALFTENDDDLILAQYYATDDTTNRMVVTRYDSLAGVLEGTFQVTFVVDSVDTDAEYRRLPDTLRFTDGQFHIENLRDRRKEED